MSTYSHKLKNKWYLRRKYFFYGRVECSVIYCGTFIPIDQGPPGMMIFICKGSHPICNICYERLELKSYQFCIPWKNCVLCRRKYYMVQITNIHHYNLRSKSRCQLKNRPFDNLSNKNYIILWRIPIWHFWPIRA